MAVYEEELEEIKSESRRDYSQYIGARVELVQPGKPLLELRPDNTLNWNFHLGQRAIMQSTKRIIAAVAGRQGGKTAIGPAWLFREMQMKGPGLYMVVAPSYPLLMDSALPKIEELFVTYFKLGKVYQNPPRFEFSDEGKRRMFRGTQWENSPLLRNPMVIRFGHASNPESLEAKTALAAWLDEAGQDAFKLASWEAIQGRVTTTLGRILITTTPYNLGWLKSRVFDPWEAWNKVLETGENPDGLKDPDIEVVAWASTTNPAFSEAEYLRLKDSMPFWKWEMFYNGKFGVPAGLIYDIAKEKESEITFKASELPKVGVRYGGLDFGGPNTGAVMAIRDPKTGVVFVYRTYRPGVTMAAPKHVRNIKLGCNYYDRFAGGAKGEVSQREEFTEAGLLVEEPEISDVQSGIDRVYGLMQQGKLRISKELTDLWSEIFTYSYETDPDTGDVLPELKIKSKSSYHLLDALRYLCSMISLGGDNPNFARGGGERTALAAYRREATEQIGLRDDNAGKMVLPSGAMVPPKAAPQMKVARGGSSSGGVRNIVKRPGSRRITYSQWEETL